MKRKIEQQLLKWKQMPNKKPLLIKGARQAGKTYSIRALGKENYKYMVEINFERDISYIELFNKTHNPIELLDYLKIPFMDISFLKNTLLFLDEIQARPDAITALKFMSGVFSCDIICSGSMLGIAIAKTTSFPVGYVETWDMYPMGFFEFLETVSISKDILNRINQSLERLEAVPETLHDKVNELFTKYMTIGGMPEMVTTYAETKPIKECLMIQRRIVNDYLNDTAKYAISGDKIEARECFQSIPAQLAEENKKFQYSVVEKGYNVRCYDSSLQWLKDNGLILEVDRLAHVAEPLVSEVELSVFKIYMADCGLFISQFDDGDIQKTIRGDLSIYEGVIHESIATQVCKRANEACLYYKPNQSIEIDFTIKYEGEITLLEVKVGIHTTSRAFQNFVRKYRVKNAFLFSKKDTGVSIDGVIKHLPLYMLEIILGQESDIF